MKLERVWLTKPFQVKPQIFDQGGDLSLYTPKSKKKKKTKYGGVAQDLQIEIEELVSVDD